jgi:hypothetical protein
MYARNRISTAVALAVGLAAPIGVVGTAHADAVFFPYLALGPQVTTIVSVMNTSGDNYNQNGTDSGSNLHYRMYYKQVDALSSQAQNALSCQETNIYLPTSQFDIQSIDLGSAFGQTTQGVLFDDPSVNNKWASSGKDYSLGNTLGNARAYLIVNNGEGHGHHMRPDHKGRTMSGEAFLFDYVNGAVWGYQASTSKDTDGDDFDFWARVGTAMPNPTTITIMPFAETTTALFVTPLANADNEWTDPDEFLQDFAGMVPSKNTYESSIGFYTPTSKHTLSPALFDRDENLISGTVDQQVVCVGRVEVQDMISIASQDEMQNGGFGGLISQRTNYLSVLGSNLVPFIPEWAADEGESSVMKLEYNAGAIFNGEVSSSGTYNNGFRLLAPAREYERHHYDKDHDFQFDGVEPAPVDPPVEVDPT